MTDETSALEPEDDDDAELTAMATVSKALRSLGQPAQRRVIEWAAGKYGVAVQGRTADRPTPVATSDHPAGGRAAPERKPRKAAEAGASAPRGGKSKGQPVIDKTLDMYPAGAKSFEDFVAEKGPADNQYEHNVAAIYWLAHEAGISPITTNQVFTCYRKVGWKLPNDLRNSLQLTAHRKGWLDTAEMDDLKIMPPGINFVERDLPRPPKAGQ